MATLAEIRAQYPEYNDLTDQQLADGIYKKHYSDMPRDQFDAKIGLVQPGKGDRLPFAPGVTPHDIPPAPPDQGALTASTNEMGQVLSFGLMDEAVAGAQAGVVDR